MEISKDALIASVSRAKTELESVLENLERTHSFDPSETRMIAHGLNNLLTVMLGTIDLLSFEIGDTPNERVREHIQTLSQTLDRTKVLVSELFNSSSLSSASNDFGMVNLNTMVLIAVDYYTRVAKKKGVDLVGIEAEPSFEVWADRVGVAVVLDNLLSNAIKYTGPGRKVWVRLKREEQSGLCSVCDEGPGLTQEDLGRLFQRGVRLSAVPTAGEPSTGYGLAVTKWVMDNMRGEIWCDTEYGQGACFRFRLPLNPPLM